MKKYLFSISGVITALMICAIGYVMQLVPKISAGTLGGFDLISFPVNKYTLKSATEQLLATDTTLVIPEKWEKLDNWDKRGYGYLDTKIFYFSSDPEEMYYVSFIGLEDTTTISRFNDSDIAVRAVSNGYRWKQEKDFSLEEKERIERRFDKEIIKRLEEILEVKSKTED